MSDPIEFSATRFVHPGTERDPATGAAVPAIYRAVSYHHGDPDTPLRYDYARSGNPTREALEQAIAMLEGGDRAMAFASGNAALASVFLLFAAGDHLIVTRDCQGGTQRMLRAVFARFGLSVSYVDTDDLAALDAALQPSTRAVLVENFSNPFLRVTDIGQVATWAHDRGVLLLVDNTFLTPYLQAPLMLGADIVLHSATKMISGHGDVTAGLATARGEDLARRLYTVQNSAGAILSPDDSYLVLRGLRTLPLRMQRAMDTAGELAQWLRSQPEVREVHYPGLPGDPGHAVAARTARGFGNMVTVRLDREDLVPPFARALRLVEVGAGFGATSTSISLPPLHCHAALTEEERVARDITMDILRLSVGLEELPDIENDFRQALDTALAEL
ncbi:MAG: PLP-dependent transferase [Thermaerobacter sp.]|nr:PLP-dependent transferase [Thermaerobacter sp.]